MTSPLVFESVSARHALPFLFSAQAQKEIVINEAIARIDSLLHATVESVQSSPPENPGEGQSWIVGDAPTGIWADHTGALATFSAGDWIFAAPASGMRCYNRATRSFAVFDTIWQSPAAPNEPAGGSTVDLELRTQFNELITNLQDAGILASQS